MIDHAQAWRMHDGDGGVPHRPSPHCGTTHQCHAVRLVTARESNREKVHGALEYLVRMALGHDYADDAKIRAAEDLIDESLP